MSDKLEFDELKNTLVIFNHGTKTYNKSKNNTNNQNSSSTRLEGMGLSVYLRTMCLCLIASYIVIVTS